MRQVNWWLSEELLDRLKDYQFDNRIESATEAARRLLEESVTRWEKKHDKPKDT